MDAGSTPAGSTQNMEIIMKNKTIYDMPQFQHDLLNKYLKQFLTSGGQDLKRIAVAPYSFGKETLFVYLFFNNSASVPEDLEQLVCDIGYQNLHGEKTGIAVGIEFLDEARPHDAITVWKEAL